MSDFSLEILGLSIRSILFMYTRVNRVYRGIDLYIRGVRI